MVGVRALLLLASHGSAWARDPGARTVAGSGRSGGAPPRHRALDRGAPGLERRRGRSRHPRERDRPGRLERPVEPAVRVGPGARRRSAGPRGDAAVRRARRSGARPRGQRVVLFARPRRGARPIRSAAHAPRSTRARRARRGRTERRRERGGSRSSISASERAGRTSRSTTSTVTCGARPDGHRGRGGRARRSRCLRVRGDARAGERGRCIESRSRIAWPGSTRDARCSAHSEEATLVDEVRRCIDLAEIDARLDLYTDGWFARAAARP